MRKPEPLPQPVVLVTFPLAPALHALLAARAREARRSVPRYVSERVASLLAEEAYR